MNRWTTLFCARAKGRASTSALVITLLSGLAVGCGDDDGGGSEKCAQAAKILEDCGMEADGMGECGAEAEAEADCVIMHPEGACSDSLTSAESQAFFNCLFEA